jgi:hypothetical protein
MNLEQGTKFVVSYIPETINGKKIQKQKMLFVLQSLMRNQKFGLQQKAKQLFTYFDLERNGYRTAKNFTITLKG